METLKVENTEVEVVEEKKSSLIKINGEITKRFEIEGIDSFKRINKVVKKSKTTGKKIVIGGLEEEDTFEIPQIDDNFILSESFHKTILKVLSAPGFHTILLSGDTGLGKTAAIEQIAARMNQPIIRENITGETKVSDIFQEANYDKIEKKIVYNDKSILKAMKKGYWLLLDEISAGSPQIMFILYRLLERAEVRTFDGQTIKAHPMFKIIFTDNRIGNPNFYRYHGTHEQNMAFLNRIKTTIFFENLKPTIESRILKGKYPEAIPIMDNLMKFAKMIRDENVKGNFSETFPIRSLESICYNFEILQDANESFNVAYLNKITEEADKDFACELFKRIFAKIENTEIAYDDNGNIIPVSI
jgi:midasin (ATPase involved in ribosome maturation)